MSPPGVIMCHGGERRPATRASPVRAQHRLPHPFPQHHHRLGVVTGLLPRRATRRPATPPGSPPTSSGPRCSRSPSPWAWSRGVAMSFQFGTNWPGYMNNVGNVAGPLLAYEVLTAFFLEATFLGVMLFGMNRVPGWVHMTPRCWSRSAPRCRRSGSWRSTRGCRPPRAGRWNEAGKLIAARLAGGDLQSRRFPTASRT